MRITLDYCRTCKGTANKINSYLHWFFFEHQVTWILVALIVFLCNLYVFNMHIQDQIIYPAEEYDKLEQIAVIHSLQHDDLVAATTLPSSINYSCSISRNEKITTTYYTPGPDRFFPSLSVTVEQTGPSFEQVSTYRNYEQATCINEMRNMFLGLFTFIGTASFFALLVLILFITSIIRNISYAKYQKEKYALYYNSGKKLDSETSESTMNEDD